MFKTLLKNGKVKYQERYKDYMTGKWKTVSITMDKDTATTRKLASSELARLISERCNDIQSKQYTLQELYNIYVAEQSKVLKASTMSRNKTTIHKVIDLLGADVIADKLTAIYIKDKLKDVDTLKQREYITRFKAFLNWSYNNELINNHDITLKLKLPADSTKKERIADKYLEQEEVAALLSALQVPDWLLLTKFLILSGLRVGEAIALTTQDIDDKYIHVTKTYDTVNDIVTSPKTSTSIRDVYIQPELGSVLKDIKRNELEKQLLYSRKTQLVFSSKDGLYIKYDSYRQYLGDISYSVLGRRITPHALRHTHASLMLAEGIDIDTISKRLGHNNSHITKEIYIHMTAKLKELEEKRISSVKLL